MFAAAGCASVQETSKVIWGSSTRALEDARPSAAKKTFSCSYDECFDAVLLYAEQGTEVILGSPEATERADYRTSDPNVTAPEARPVVKRKNFDIFIKDRVNQRIVLMGVPGAVDTTEVGVFFTEVDGKGTRLEITSLSTAAKVKAAEMVFPELGKMFKEITEDAGR